MGKEKKIAKTGNLIGEIKNQIKKSGANKKKFMYFKSGTKARVRFLQELDEGFKIPFHDSYQQGINVPCQKIFGRECPHCGDDELRHRDLYAWSVWDYEAKEENILMGPVNQCSAVPGLVGMFEAYGTILDRDYLITKNGQGANATFSIVPMDKAKFKNKQAKPFSESKFLKMLDKAFPDDTDKEDSDDEEEFEEQEEENENNEEEYDYEEMSAKELYKLCKERNIKAKPKQDEDYYIELLEEYDEEEGDEDDEDDDDDWE